LTTGNQGLDALADAIAERVLARMEAASAPTYISAQEVARRLNLSVRSVQDRASRGALPSVRIGKRVLFRWGDVERVILQEGKA
jgi:excisionase family DNA binding protein